uniref:RNA-directed RNA polymerase n=1 Tax=Leviviridae sp. TaxID=2027243 RepID=A0A514D746_9VIRU|nr:MAG: RNA-dependent RNA polymerase [Leviviridae sp.]
MVAVELATRCHTCASHDIKTVAARTEHEGFSFLTIALPGFGKGLEKALDLGQAAPMLFPGFHTSRKACLPDFLGGFTERVFDRYSGVLLDNPDADAILAVRQLTLMFGKILLPCSDARTQAAFDGYIECENEVRSSDSRRSASDSADFKRIATLLFGRLFADLDQKVFDRLDVVPKHGPGSTADRRRGNAKYKQRDWPMRLQEIFPWEEFLAPSASFWESMADDVNLIEPGAEIPVKVISVPKTMKTPRIIAMEPTAMMYVQQALNAVILAGIQENYLLRNMLDTRDQTPNQRLAREGSLTGALATLDLSEASDRVSNQLVRTMLEDYPHLHWAVDASRSRKADVPGHGVIRLAKFASMGSALCFPFEAMVFLTLIFLGIERESSTLLTRRKLERYVGKVRVYGDDIICPVDSVDSVVSVLTLFGAKVNTGKSFWTGRFRESCGKEYYAGEDISIVRVRREFPTSPKDAARVMSIISLRNQFYKTGLWATVKWLDEEIRKVIRYFPDISESSRVHGRLTFLGYQAEKMHPTLHAPMVRGYVEVSKSPENSLGGQDALLKFFLERGEQPLFNEDHLERSGRPVAVDIKPRWAQPF